MNGFALKHAVAMKNTRIAASVPVAHGMSSRFLPRLVAIAMVSFRRGSEPLESIESLKRDLDAVKGTGEYDRR